jgi:hypothetical protein
LTAKPGFIYFNTGTTVSGLGHFGRLRTQRELRVRFWAIG